MAWAMVRMIVPIMVVTKEPTADTAPIPTRRAIVCIDLDDEDDCPVTEKWFPPILPGQCEVEFRES